MCLYFNPRGNTHVYFFFISEFLCFNISYSTQEEEVLKQMVLNTIIYDCISGYIPLGSLIQRVNFHISRVDILTPIWERSLMSNGTHSTLFLVALLWLLWFFIHLLLAGPYSSLSWMRMIVYVSELTIFVTNTWEENQLLWNKGLILAYSVIYLNLYLFDPAVLGSWQHNSLLTCIGKGVDHQETVREGKKRGKYPNTLLKHMPSPQCSLFLPLDLICNSFYPTQQPQDVYQAF